MASKKWIKTSNPGVRYREHPERKHGVGRDRYFSIRYKLKGKDKEEGIGWASDGWTAKKASILLAKLKKAHLTGEGPQSLEETRADAEKEKAKIAQQEEIARIQAITFGEFFRQQYLPVAKTTKRDKSWKTEQSLFEKYIGPVVGNMPFKDVTPDHLELVKKNMLEMDRKPRSIQYCFATFRQCWNMAKDRELVAKDSPTKKVSIPKVENGRFRYLRQKEAIDLLDALYTRSPTVYNIAVLSLYAGLRAGEIFNLTWGDIDFDSDTITIRDAKGYKSRKAYMTELIKKILFSLRADQPVSEYVFQSRNGKKITEVSHAFDRAVESLNLNKDVVDQRDKVVFHTLRHTFASWLVLNGTNLYTVKELMGHSTLKMTERYAHLGQSHLRTAVRSFDTMA